MPAVSATSPTRRTLSFCTSTERIKFNYNDVIKGKHMEQNIQLKPGDIIVVR